MCTMIIPIQVSFAFLFVFARVIAARNDVAYQSFVNATTTTTSTSLESNENTATHDEISRNLQASISDFVPLSCNANLPTTPCESWLTLFGNESEYNDRINIPCGSCIIMDNTEPVVTFQQGIDIIGKLVFPESYRVVVQTPLVVVQGELVLEAATKPVSGMPDIKFIMTGDYDQYFIPHENNANACGMATSCSVGKKSFVVAGGIINGTKSNI
jgi:G8 domain